MCVAPLKQAAQGQACCALSGGGGVQWRANQLGRCEDIVNVSVTVERCEYLWKVPSILVNIRIKNLRVIGVGGKCFKYSVTRKDINEYTGGQGGSPPAGWWI